MSNNPTNKRRKELRKELSLIEKQIYDLETTYLEETREIGSVFTGWKSFLSTDKVKTKKQILNEERLFSLSSITSPASKKTETKELKQEKSEAAAKAGGESKAEGKKRKAVDKIEVEF